MTKICFVRHGETDWNTAGILQGQHNTSLNAKGQEQAEATGAYLAAQNFDLLITSSLRRAKKTAEIMNKHLQLPILEMDAFMERAFGKAEGLTYEKRERLYSDNNVPGEETETDFYARVVGGFQEITAAYPNKHILLVSHGLVINLILSLLLNEEIDYKKTALLNGCINHIHFIDNTWQIKSINEVSHLNGTIRDSL
ncbi:histidine phosphatase family protein [Oceanobacillus sp. FSL H7-0719]|uniref:histidine phosphatase family protein n=1 Tax=Oceanobacillus sp. FSL H7-0719 TaxID=2954507 RepID=UPI00324625F3